MHMENDPTFFSVLISWFPMLLLIAVWLWFMFKLKGTYKSRDGRGYTDLLIDCQQEQRRTNELLERFVNDYGERIRRLEQKQ